ncbi:MAG: MFS transporter [Pseudomonadota bacterium]
MSVLRMRMLFLNVGHFLDHYFILIFATAAALRLTSEWGMSYAELIPYATPCFVAFGVCAIPAGWLADRWSREDMIVIFFIGIGACAILSGFANTPLQISICLTAMGVFAAIYHPVGLSLVVQGITKTGIPLAINGVFGNLGVACAALLTGFLIDVSGWRSVYLLTGVISIVCGLLYAGFNRKYAQELQSVNQHNAKAAGATPSPLSPMLLLRVFAIIFTTTALGGLIFQSTTFALPKVFEERLTDIAASATMVGWYAFIVFSVAAFAQLVVGYLVDRFSIRLVFAWVALLQVVFLALMMTVENVAALLVAIGFMLAVFGQIPINDVLVGRMAKSEWRSRAYACRYIVTFSVMASAVPLIAWIHGTWGFDALFGVLAATAMLIFVTVSGLPRNLTPPSTNSV